MDKSDVSHPRPQSIAHTPYVTYTLLALNILVFLAYYPALRGDPRALGAFWDSWAIVPAEITAGEDYFTLVTGMFLHGGWMHLIGNVLFLYIFGDNIEDMLGHVKFLVFYLLCGFAASFIQILAGPNFGVPVVGASGAIAGVLGSYLWFYPKARVDIIIFIVIFKTFTLPAWIVLCGWFGMQVFGGLSSPSTGGGVAYWAQYRRLCRRRSDGHALLVAPWGQNILGPDRRPSTPSPDKCANHDPHCAPSQTLRGVGYKKTPRTAGRFLNSNGRLKPLSQPVASRFLHG